MDIATVKETRQSPLVDQIEGILKLLNEGSFMRYRAVSRLIESGERYVIECVFEPHAAYANSRVNAQRDLSRMLSKIPGAYGAEKLPGTIVDDHLFQIAFKVR